MSPSRVLVPVSARSAITAPTTGPNLKPWPLHAEQIKTLPLSSTASIVNSWSGVYGKENESACISTSISLQRAARGHAPLYTCSSQRAQARWRRRQACGA